MNKNRARTQRRMAKRLNTHKPNSKAAMLVTQKLNAANNPHPPCVLALDFEIQKRDATGRYRKAAGVPRVHTFGLARLRWLKLSLPFEPTHRRDNCVPTHVVSVAPTFRIRNVKTGQTWDVLDGI